MKCSKKYKAILNNIVGDAIFNPVEISTNNYAYLSFTIKMLLKFILCYPGRQTSHIQVVPRILHITEILTPGQVWNYSHLNNALNKSD